VAAFNTPLHKHATLDPLISEFSIGQGGHIFFTLANIVFSWRSDPSPLSSV